VDALRRKHTQRDPSEADQRQEDWDEVDSLVEIARETDAKQHGPESGRVQNECEHGRMRPGSGEESKHEQKSEQTPARGRPQTISKRKSVMIWSGSRVENVCFMASNAMPAIRFGSESTNEMTYVNPFIPAADLQ
jgi:hypothetical protein